MSVHPPSLPGPSDIHKTVLGNGITVLARSNFNSPSVSVGGYLPAGALLEPDEKLGLADFVSSSLMRGTTSRSFDAIYNELESVGSSLGFDSGVHNISFGARCLLEDLPLVLTLLSESLQGPVFPKDEVERLRIQFLTGLSLRAQDTAEMADLHFDQMLFAGHPYSRPSDGFPETVQSITRKDLKEFHRFHFGPKGMVIALVGAIHPEKAAEEVNRLLGGWQASAQKEAPVLPAHKPIRRLARRHHVIHGKSQTDILMGGVGPRRKDPDYLSASLGNSVLGQFGMMGRIGAAVRETSGLAYYAYSVLDSGTGPGRWNVTAGVNPSKVKKTIELIEKELRRFVKEGVTRQELADSQEYYIGRLPLSLESNSGVASALLNLHRFDFGLDYYLQYAGRVKAVTRDEVLETARKYIHPDRLVISTAGP